VEPIIVFMRQPIPLREGETEEQARLDISVHWTPTVGTLAEAARIIEEILVSMRARIAEEQRNGVASTEPA